jgi:hypothetical protein
VPSNDFVECLVVFDSVNDMFPVFPFGLAYCAVEFACGFRGAIVYTVPKEEVALVRLLALWCPPWCRVACSAVWLPYCLNTGVENFCDSYSVSVNVR